MEYYILMNGSGRHHIFVHGQGSLHGPSAHISSDRRPMRLMSLYGAHRWVEWMRNSFGYKLYNGNEAPKRPKYRKRK